MSTWFRETPESLRLLAEERAVVEAAELVSGAMATRNSTRKALADKLGIARSEITQRLSGRRNLTVRSLAAMLHELGFELQLRIRDHREDGVVWRTSAQVDTDILHAAGETTIRLVKRAA